MGRPAILLVNDADLTFDLGRLSFPAPLLEGLKRGGPKWDRSPALPPIPTSNSMKVNLNKVSSNFPPLQINPHLLL